MPQETNLNVSPYFDDFDATNDFHRVLFKPGYPVQARELTTLQSILQNQIENFGDHIFREGSKVIPGQLSVQQNYYAVQVEAAYFGIPVSFYADKLVGKRIKGETSGVTAKIVNWIDESTSDNGNVTFYVQYEKSSTTFSGQVFNDGETLLTLSSITYAKTTIASNEGFATAIPSNATATGSAVQITEGVYFLRGNFVRVAQQTLILDQYNNSPSYRVGLSVVEDIITAGADDSLYDNAQGFSNYAAPGADRLKISAILAKRELDELNDENFVEIMRLVDGQKEWFEDDNQYSLIRDALAKRTYDESGDYYVKPFRLTVKESLNDKKGNKGIYLPGQTTQDGNTPSSDLMIYQISPGKAYVRGYDIETISNTNLDVPKARTTKTIENDGIDYNTGSQFIVNNVYGAPNVGLGTTSYISLRDQRIGGVWKDPAGTEIGKAKVYNFSAESVNLSWGEHGENDWDLRLFDIQTYTKVGISTYLSITAPAHITGDSSGAEGYITASITNADEFTIYCNNGQFVKDESFKVNGNDVGPVIKTIRDYGINDVYSVHSSEAIGNLGVGQTFNADVELGKSVIPISDSFVGNNPTFVVTAGDQGISTVTSPGNNFAGIVTVGNYIGYSVAGLNTETYNRVSAVSDDGNSLTVVSVTNVPGVAAGALPTAEVNTESLSIRSVSNILFDNNSFVTKLPSSNISDIDILSSNVIVKKQFRNITVANNEIAASQFNIGSDHYYQPFTPQRYLISYGDGRREALTADQVVISDDSKTLRFVNLSVAADSLARVDVTLKKENPSSKEKRWNVGKTLITRSNQAGSGIGGTTLNNGLTYSTLYGTRVEDKEISLNVPDVIRVLGVYESNDTSEADLPSVTLGSLSGPNATTADLIVGEEIESNNGAIAVVVEKTNASQIGISYINGQKFQLSDILTFKSSGITGSVTAFTIGDRDISTNYTLDAGQRSSFYDYSRIWRDVSSIPDGQLKVVYQYYTVPADDTGDIFSVKSYDADRYDNDIYYLDSTLLERLTDYIDIRPRVSTFDPATATKSPFEFDSRVFSGTGNTPPNILSDDEIINVSYSYYLPRVDRLFLTTNGSFQLQTGVPDDNPQPPVTISGALDVGTFWIPAYTYEAEQVKTLLKSYKRYRMSDITRLDNRVKNLEYYTALSLLETDTKNMAIRDANGLDRFKAGFLVDNFKNGTASSSQDPDYNASLDLANGEMRPSHYTTAVDLLLGTNSIIGIGQTADPSQDWGFSQDLVGSGCRRTGDIVTLDYTEVSCLANTYASRTENVQPFAVIFWRGSMELNPSSDVWIDTRRIDANVVEIEGDFEDTLEETGADVNTGLISTRWNAWQTDWVGVDITQVVTQEIENRGDRIPRPIRRRVPNPRRRGQTEVRTQGVTVNSTRVRVRVTNTDRITRTGQSRTGVGTRVVERIDSESLGDRVVNRDNIPFMRARNLEFVIRRVKPRTQLFPFFDGQSVAEFCFPKLLEVTMVNGTFTVGETVEATPSIRALESPWQSQPYCRFRVAVLNHKYGPYNAPSDIYTVNPYNDDESLPELYTSTSSILNVDTFSLQLQPQGQFFGWMNGNMTLRGLSSGAEATITRTRLISDNVGTLQGSFWIPDATRDANPAFEAGTKNLRFTSSAINSLIPGTVTTSVDQNFESSGVIETIQETIINTRNADVVTESLTDNRVLTDVQRNIINRQDIGIIDRSTTTVQQQIITQFYDPLAQSFDVGDPNGIFITSIDLFFSTKDDTLPCSVEIRTCELGTPTTTILPLSQKELMPDQINVSSDASLATNFTFDSPVFLEGGGEYAIVVVSPSTEYNVWISRLGDEDISTTQLGESQRVVITQQPYLGSLFKSQNASTWTPSQFEDLKFTLYKALFTAGTPGTVNFYSPELEIGNNELIELNPNPITALSKKVTLGLTSAIADTSIINNGVSIGQTGTSVSIPTGSIVGTGGSVLKEAVGLSTDSLLSVNPGSGYTVATTTGVQPYTITGKGSGLEVDIFVGIGNSIYQDPNNKAGPVGFVSVTQCGTGYQVGDVVGIPTAACNGIGTGAQLSVVAIGFTNTVFLDRVQGDFLAGVGNTVTYVTNTGISSDLNGDGSNVLIKTGEVINDPYYDGRTIRVNHRNHAMHEPNNLVKIDGVLSDAAPATLSANLDRDATGDFSISAGAAFTSFENVGVGTTNPGYLKISNEIIKYTGVNTSTNAITGITRAQDSSLAYTHPENSLVYLYQFNGVSLRRINKTHNFSEVQSQGSHPITMDSYYIGIDAGETSSDNIGIGTSRANSAGGLPSLYFNQTKSGGESRITASQNIQFETLTPNIQTLTPRGTTIDSRVRTVSARSISGIETSFEDKGFRSIPLNGVTAFESPRMIASKVNEDSKLSTLPGSKSMNLQLDLSSNDPNVSPVVDIDRVSAILTTNKIDDPVTIFAEDDRVKIPGEDPNSATYVTKNVGLRVPATGIKVLFSAHRAATSDIRVAYSIFRQDDADNAQRYELFPGYDNRDDNGAIINVKNNSGLPDVFVPASMDRSDYRDYEFTIDALTEFSGFKIQIMMTATNQAYPPIVKEFRAIALS